MGIHTGIFFKKELNYFFSIFSNVIVQEDITPEEATRSGTTI